MKQYLDLLENIIENGVEKESGRDNMPNTIGLSHGFIEMNMADGFPLLTTKKMYFKGIIHELLWFLRGETNIKYLVDNNVNIWNGDAYRWYLKYVSTMVEPDYEYLADDPNENKTRPFTMEEFIENIKEGRLGSYDYKLGDLGKVYGYQWRNQNGVDQVKEVLDGLKNNPYSRYHIIDGWNKADFKEMALPPCHLLYQFIVRPLSFDQRMDIYRERNNGMMLNFDSVDRVNNAFNDLGIPQFYLDLNMYQRSADSACGIPFNLASMSLLLMLFAKTTNMIAGVARWIGGDTHLYVNHVNEAKEQIKRKPFDLPRLIINKKLLSLEDILNLTINDFELINYQSHPTIKYELFTGVKIN